MASVHCFLGSSLWSPMITLRRQFNLPGLINTQKRPSPIGACLNVDISQMKNVEIGAKTQKVIEEEARVIMGTYARAPVVFSHGKGSKLFDVEGREYLDMTSGIAVNALGHGDPDWVLAVTQQAHALCHVSNIFYSVPMVRPPSSGCYHACWSNCCRCLSVWHYCCCCQLSICSDTGCIN